MSDCSEPGWHFSHRLAKEYTKPNWNKVDLSLQCKVINAHVLSTSTLMLKSFFWMKVTVLLQHKSPDPLVKVPSGAASTQHVVYWLFWNRAAQSFIFTACIKSVLKSIKSDIEYDCHALVCWKLSWKRHLTEKIWQKYWSTQVTILAIWVLKHTNTEGLWSSVTVLCNTHTEKENPWSLSPHT